MYAATSRFPSLATCALVMLASASTLSVASAQTSTLPPILPEAREIALAVSAGPTRNASAPGSRT
jgi:predicted component of type VI protein secretion system